MNPTRRAVEDAWKERLQLAHTCYRLAANETPYSQIIHRTDFDVKTL